MLEKLTPIRDRDDCWRKRDGSRRGVIGCRLACFCATCESVTLEAWGDDIAESSHWDIAASAFPGWVSLSETDDGDEEQPAVDGRADAMSSEPAARVRNSNVSDSLSARASIPVGSVNAVLSLSNAPTVAWIRGEVRGLVGCSILGSAESKSSKDGGMPDESIMVRPGSMRAKYDGKSTTSALITVAGEIAERGDALW